MSWELKEESLSWRLKTDVSTGWSYSWGERGSNLYTDVSSVTLHCTWTGSSLLYRERNIKRKRTTVSLLNLVFIDRTRDLVVDSYRLVASSIRTLGLPWLWRDQCKQPSAKTSHYLFIWVWPNTPSPSPTVLRCLSSCPMRKIFEVSLRSFYTSSSNTL